MTECFLYHTSAMYIFLLYVFPFAFVKLVSAHLDLTLILAIAVLDCSFKTFNVHVTLQWKRRCWSCLQMVVKTDIYPNDRLSSFNGGTCWSFEYTPTCYQNSKNIFSCTLCLAMVSYAKANAIRQGSPRK